LQTSTYYVRDAGGREVAIYNGPNLVQYNVFGLDNVGYIDASGGKYFYLKDHLGSVRVVIDTNATVVSAYDYDPWGYPLQNRTYDAGSTTQRYKFTNKERDLETAGDGITGYDYFGARYYDSRIANWTSVDPLMEKHSDFSPYNYVLRSPIALKDPDGRQDIVTEGLKAITTVVTVEAETVGTIATADFAIGTAIVGSIFVPVNITPLGTKDVKENMSWDESVGQTQGVTVTNLFAQHGKNRVKETDHDSKSNEELLKTRDELSTKKRTKEDKAELKRILKTLKDRGIRPSRQSKDSKYDSKMDPNN